MRTLAWNIHSRPQARFLKNWEVFSAKNWWNFFERVHILIVFKIRCRGQKLHGSETPRLMKNFSKISLSFFRLFQGFCAWTQLPWSLSDYNCRFQFRLTDRRSSSVCGACSPTPRFSQQHWDSVFPLAVPRLSRDTLCWDRAIRLSPLHRILNTKNGVQSWCPQLA